MSKTSGRFGAAPKGRNMVARGIATGHAPAKIIKPCQGFVIICMTLLGALPQAITFRPFGLV
jgi:hypothetical protein